MKKREFNRVLRAAVPPASPRFGQAIRDTLAQLEHAQGAKEEPVKLKINKRRTMYIVLAAIVLVATVAAAATLLAQNLFDVTMGEIPQNAASITRYNLAGETVGDAEITVKEAAYDGMSLYILCGVRDMTAAEPLGEADEISGERYLTDDDYDRINALDASLWLDGLWIDGRYVSMPNMSITQDLPGAENGEILYYFMLRLDQNDLYLDGKNVEIALPIGRPQAYDTLTYDEETGELEKPEAGLISFNLDCSGHDQVTVTHPEYLTVGAKWSAKAGQVVYSPLQLYITLDWEIKPEVLAAYLAENGDGYYENGVKYWDYDAVEVCGGEMISMRLVDETGDYVFDGMDGFHGCGGVSNTQAWYTFPYAETYPEPMYLAPEIDGELDMAQAVRIR